MRIRILPLVIFVILVSFVIKISEIFIKDKGNPFAKVNYKYTMLAQENISEEDELTSEDEKKEEQEPEATLSPGYDSGGPVSPNISDTLPEDTVLMQNLSKRRKELDRWEKSIEMKQSVLQATEKKINMKISELEKLQKEVSKLLASYNDKEDQKIKRLVKIYENMKAKDAAPIFEQMDLDILLQVVSKMRETNSAKILANLTPEKAKIVSEMLIEYKTLSNKNISSR